VKEIKLEQKQSRSGRRTGSYIGSIPNTPEHRKLVLKLSKHLRAHGKVQLEGRHSNRNQLCDHLFDIDHPTCYYRDTYNNRITKLSWGRRRTTLISHVPVEFAQSFDVYLLCRPWTNPLGGVPKFWKMSLPELEVYESILKVTK